MWSHIESKERAGSDFYFTVNEGMDVSIALAGTIEDIIRRAYQNRTLESVLEYEEKFELSMK